MNRKLKAVLVGGLIAGAFDITYAITFSYLRRGIAPSRVLQSVASGLLGQGAFDGGAATAVLGLGLHFFIALSFAAAYVVAAGRLAVLARRPVLCGGVYGTFVFAFMNLVVLPLSRTPARTSFPLAVLGSGLAVHIFLIGVPIALAARRAYATADGNTGTG